MTLYKNAILIILTAILLCCASVASSQNSGAVKGKVMYKETPVEFATVLLYYAADSSKPVKATLTDSAGIFYINEVATGDYLLKIQVTTFDPIHRTIVLNKQQPDYDAGNLTLNVAAKQLQTVTVTAQKSLIQRTTQGFIVNAGSNLTQAGGTVTDLLRGTPTIVVDAEGSITMRGKVPLILINGRNSGITGTEQIPASSVESIEIINNPSAQYDAEAEGGIINIRLKKNNQNGTNGALAIGTGFGAKGRINSSAYLNHKTGKWSYSIAYDNRFAGRTRKVNGDRIIYSSQEEHFLTQRRFDNRVERLQNLRLNLDFSPGKKNTFGFEAIGNLNGEDNDESLINTINTKANSFNAKYNRRSWEVRKAKVGELAFNYSRKYNDARKSLTAGVNTAFNNDRENTDITSQSLTENNAADGDAFLQKTHNYQNTNITNLKADYVQPLRGRAVIETGYKATLRFLDANFQSQDNVNGSYVINPDASNVFRFNEQIHAAYLQYSSFTGEKVSPRWKYDIGLRMEQVWNDGKTGNNNAKFNNNYFKLFPSANIVYYHQQKEFWKLSYSRRINRPGLGQLNPFTDITDSLNQRSGNPDLKPELVHSLEFGYNKDWEKVTFYAVLFYRNASNAIRPFTVLRPDGVAFTQPLNFGNAANYGMENVVGARPFRNYDFNLSISFFQQDIEGGDETKEVTNHAFSWYGKLINNFVFWRGSKLQIIGVYNSPTATPQGERIAIYNVDMGFQQKIGKGNGRVGLTLTDIFNTQKNGFLTKGENFTFSRIVKVDTRAVFITFAYTFGTSFKEKLMENQFSND